jgi:hypothetical protein
VTLDVLFKFCYGSATIAASPFTHFCDPMTSNTVRLLERHAIAAALQPIRD